MDSSISPKDEIWFLRVCHHISNAVYLTESHNLFLPYPLKFFVFPIQFYVYLCVLFYTAEDGLL